MKNLLNNCSDCIAKILKTRPLAVFSIISFFFIVMRLYIDIQPLLFVAFFIGFVLICLKIYKKLDLFITVFIFIAAFLGLFVTQYNISKSNGLINELKEQNVTITGQVASVPVKHGARTDFYVDCNKILHNRGQITENTKVIVSTYDNYSLKFGDNITFNGHLTPSHGKNINTNFSYAAHGAHLKCNMKTLLEVSDARFPYSFVPCVRNYIIDIGNKFFKGESAMLFKALVAGDKSGFSDSLTKNLSVSGLSHIAAVSGLHVSILGLAVFYLLRRKNRLLACVLSVLMVVLFTLTTGASLSTCRAAIMFICYILSGLFLEENDSFTALCLSAMLLGLNNPYVIFDWGFILSFLSVLGILIFSSPIKRTLKFMPSYLSDPISATVSAQIMTIPALTIMFGGLSTYSVPANILISFIFVWALYMCIIFVPVSLVPLFNVVFATVTGFLLHAITATANLFASLPFATLKADAFNLYECIVYYTVIIIFAFRRKIHEYAVAAILFLCSFVLIFGYFSENVLIKEKPLCESSAVLTKDNTVVLVNDELYDVYTELKEWGGADRIDHLVISENTDVTVRVINDLDSLSEINEIHLPYKEKNKEYTEIIERKGIVIHYYTENNENLRKYAEKLTENSVQ